jgi:hypothetical protein
MFSRSAMSVYLHIRVLDGHKDNIAALPEMRNHRRMATATVAATVPSLGEATRQVNGTNSASAGIHGIEIDGFPENSISLRMQR